MSVLAVIPAYNEAEHIAAVVAAVRPRLPVVVVDDGSRDETVRRAEAAGAQVLRQIPNQGKGAALRVGFRYAITLGYSAVLTLDADGQHDPVEIPQFLARFAEAAPDLIVGARDFSRMPLVRRVSNTIGRWSFSWALGQPVRDCQSGYRLLSAALMERLFTSQETGFEFEVEMIVMCVRNGLRLDWVPIRTIYTGGGSHIHLWHHFWNFYRAVWETRFGKWRR